MILLRSVLFYLGYSLVTLVWGTLSVLVGWALPSRPRFMFIIGVWTRVCLWWLKVTCGIRVEVFGRENLPDKACVVLCRHESTWETLFLQTLLAPQATIIKRELLWIPFFGWAFALNKPIAIDRGTPRSALKRLITVGKSRLAEGIWVVLFPEGTRMPPRTMGRFQIGGAALASAAEAQVVVIAHNAGNHWPAHQLAKQAGTIEVRIMPPIQTIGRDSKSITADAEALLAEGQKTLAGRG
jgi:1-acyl-sn-glycerol-3-phosphate acyltransferase